MLLTEKLNSFIESVDSKPTNEHCLGKIRGIGSNYATPTRNGRRYPRELWEKVMASDDFKEMMDTHTCFGELDHPEERIDSSIKEVATVLTDMYFDDSKQSVMIEMDILDTPRGRLLKELVDCGCRLGVSSRGLGDERQVNGETIIDPETYSFFAYDIVCTPANMTSRPAMVAESVNYKKLSESISSEIEKASSIDDLNSIKRIVEATEMPDLASITEAINIKLESYKTGDNISDKLESDLGALAQENEKLKSELEKLQSQLNANNIRLSETKTLLKKSRESSRNLSKNLQESMKQISSLQSDVFDSAIQLENLTKAIESNRRKYHSRINRINEKCHEVMEKLSESQDSNSHFKKMYEDAVNETSSVASDYESRIEAIESRYQREMSEMTEKNTRLENRISIMSHNMNTKIQYMESKHQSEISELESRHSDEMSQMMDKNSKLESQINKLTSDKKLVENRAASNKSNMSKKLDEANKAIKTLTTDYIKTRCAQEGISVESLMSSLPKNYTKDDVDKKLSEMSDRNRRLGKLPIAMRPVAVRLEENVDMMSEEDRQLYTILNNSFK